jgi:hypothetical protein
MAGSCNRLSIHGMGLQRTNLCLKKHRVAEVYRGAFLRNAEFNEFCLRPEFELKNSSKKAFPYYKKMV